MGIARLPNVSGPVSVDDARRGAAADPDRQRLREVAQEFESLLILQMVKQMRQTFLAQEDEGDGFGAETMTETFDVELSRTLARQGGFGLAALMERALNDLADDDPGRAAAGSAVGRPESAVDPPTATRVSGEMAGGPASVDGRTGGPGGPDPGMALAAAGLALPLDAATSSPFGWRADPFHGARRFHAGLDFRAAYGREVPVAAAGRVSFAGSQGAYGLTVVVDHGNGVQTRYAHLASLTVQAGQELARGEVIGRVGRTGRATGPHLHFEVALDGRKVDPALVAARVPGGLKLSGADDDFPGERVPAGASAMGVNHEN